MARVKPAPAPMPKKRFTGNEDRARIAIVAAMQRRVKWTEVVAQLEAEGYPKRSVESVRNRHRRWQKADATKPESKNMCRICGLPQRGHVCGGVNAQ